MNDTAPLPTTSFHEVRAALLENREIALLDVREEDPFAAEHPLFASNLPCARIEMDALWRMPRLTARIVVYDDGEGLADPAARRLRALGFSNVALLEDGLGGWRRAGGELFKDVNVPSKAFGELVESRRHTPSLPAQEMQALIDAKADMVVLDARPFEEYHTMNIPGGMNVPGGELALRVRALAPDPKTRVIVNCAGRTRSIIGAQSLINAGIPNPVAALRNGTIGWTLAGQKLEQGQRRRFADVPAALAAEEPHAADPRTAFAARELALRAGVKHATPAQLGGWLAEPDRTTYVFDVRTPEEYARGHLPGARCTPGGQLVQETDVQAPVRGARLVLVDTDGVRAHMTASWLAQMHWDVHVLEGVPASSFTERGPWQPARAPLPSARLVTPVELQRWLASNDGSVVLDLGTSAAYVKQHIPGAWFALRSQWPQVLAKIGTPPRIVLTGDGSPLALYAAGELQALAGPAKVCVLEGGNPAWSEAGFEPERGESRLASPRIDRYRRPYEGTDNPLAAMQAYLDWEFGLVEQLARDATHGFKVV